MWKFINTHKLYLLSKSLSRYFKNKTFSSSHRIHYFSLYEHSFLIKCSGRLNDFVTGKKILITRVMCACITKNSWLIVPISTLFQEQPDIVIYCKHLKTFKGKQIALFIQINSELRVRVWRELNPIYQWRFDKREEFGVCPYLYKTNEDEWMG